jgi:hypothetical protein
MAMSPATESQSRGRGRLLASVVLAFAAILVVGASTLAASSQRTSGATNASPRRAAASAPRMNVKGAIGQCDDTPAVATSASPGAGQCGVSEAAESGTCRGDLAVSTLGAPSPELLVSRY